MPLTLADIQQGVSESPELKNEILAAFEPDATDYLKGKGFELFTADQKAELLKNYESEKISPRIKEIAGNIEKEVFELTGIKKEHDEEKYYAYTKRAISTLKAQIGDLQKAGVTDEVTKQRIAALEAELEQAKGLSESLKKEYATEKLNLRLANSFAGAFNDLKINVPEGVSEQEAEAYRSNKRAMLQSALLSQYTPVEQDGKLVYQDKEGKVAMTGGNYATEKDLLTANFKYEFESEQRRKGTGQQGGGYQGGTLPNVTDKQGIYAQANKEGLTTGSKAWTERVVEIAKQKNISLEG